jgi:hypothetical protein
VKPTSAENILSNIPGLSYTSANATIAPPGSSPFLFKKSATHRIRLEYQAWNYNQKIENQNSLNAQVLLFWNLVDKIDPVKQVSFLEEIYHLLRRLWILSEKGRSSCLRLRPHHIGSWSQLE